MKEMREWEYQSISDIGSKRTKGWILKRMLRDNGRDITHCENCGQKFGKRKITIHHKNGNSHDNRPQNLLILCRQCHDKIEA